MRKRFSLSRARAVAGNLRLGDCAGQLGLTVLFLVMAAEIANNPNAANGDPAELFVFLGCCGGIFGVPYGIAMAIGGRAMRNLSSRGWAMAGGILGVAAFRSSAYSASFTPLWAPGRSITLDKPAGARGLRVPPKPGERRRRRQTRLGRLTRLHRDEVGAEEAVLRWAGREPQRHHRVHRQQHRRGEPQPGGEV